MTMMDDFEQTLTAEVKYIEAMNINFEFFCNMVLIPVQTIIEKTTTSNFTTTLKNSELKYILIKIVLK